MREVQLNVCLFKCEYVNVFYACERAHTHASIYITQPHTLALTHSHSRTDALTHTRLRTHNGREREGLLEDLLETPCKASPTHNMQTNGDIQHAKEFWMLRNEFASAQRRWEKELEHLQNQFQLLELELKALHMDYDSAKDRWQR